ncbi:acyl-CoA thioesterase [Balneatrix alpica]|uniref:Acyl-CoA thioesterase n=1 Tax=Balneatrix alpica TaxID=75684 RepID=A0ABV5ZB59_9GAMM|nr:thioesterase family protein [Balneatrix alpica]
MSFTTKLKVHGFHLDSFGHVNNARYLEFLEAARWDWLAASDCMQVLQQEQVVFAIVNININYKAEARLGDVLDISCAVGRLGEKSVQLTQEVRRERDQVVVADATITFVFMDVRTRQARPVEGRLRELMLAAV